MREFGEKVRELAGGHRVVRRRNSFHDRLIGGLDDREEGLGLKGTDFATVPVGS